MFPSCLKMCKIYIFDCHVYLPFVFVMFIYPLFLSCLFTHCFYHVYLPFVLYLLNVLFVTMNVLNKEMSIHKTFIYYSK